MFCPIPEIVGKPWRNFRQEATQSLWQQSDGDEKASEEVVQTVWSERARQWGQGKGRDPGHVLHEEIQDTSRRLNGQVSVNAQIRC